MWFTTPACYAIVTVAIRLSEPEISMSTPNDIVQQTTNQTRNWWERFLHQTRSIDYDALAQFIESLRAESEIVANMEGETTPGSTEILARVSAKLDEAEDRKTPLEGRWNKAYHAERLLLSFLTPERQVIELDRRLDESRRVDAPFSTFYHEQLAAASIPIPAGRTLALLESLVKDLQRHKSNKHLRMRYARAAVYKVGVSFSIALLIFIMVVSMVHWNAQLAEALGAG